MTAPTSLVFSGRRMRDRCRPSSRRALAAIEGKHVTVAGAGRTDAGVHALGQVASFKLSSAIAENDLFRALNAKLPEDVRVLSAEVAAPGFNARFSARSKMYRYRISNTRVHEPVPAAFAWHISRDARSGCDGRRRTRAAGRARFRVVSGSAEPSERRNRARTDTTRTMTRSVWTEEPLAGGGRLLIYEIAGTGFLKYMVRDRRRTLVEVGDGRRTPASLRDLLDSRRPRRGRPDGAPAGLYLVRVDYDAAAPVSF